jgi:hypothetical protein
MGEKRRAPIVMVSVAVAVAVLFGLSLRHPSTASPPPIVGKAPGLDLRFFRWPGVQIKPGETIKPAEPIGVAYRNLGNESLWALIFAYDSQGELHWLQPHHTIGTRADDLSVQLAASPAGSPAGSENERNLPGASHWDELPAGPFTVFAVVTPAIMVTSRIERLDPSERNRESLLARFPDAVVIELPLVVPPK